MDVYALDFDGVICDSCGESSQSAIKAARIRWPQLFDGVSSKAEEWILEQMRTVRPVVETGYENILLARLLLEIKCPEKRESQLAKSGITVADILSGWESTVKPSVMADWGETGKRDELIHLFGDVRDKWIAEDLSTWIAANRLYPGAADALRFATSPIYIVTTKQTRFALALLRELAGIDFPEDHTFGLGTGPKVQTLQQLQARPEHAGANLHFVEDRLATLKNVIKTPALDSWRLYLGTWGYNTEAERAAAAEYERIHVIDLPEFCKNLK